MYIFSKCTFYGNGRLTRDKKYILYAFVQENFTWRRSVRNSITIYTLNTSRTHNENTISSRIISARAVYNEVGMCIKSTII